MPVLQLVLLVFGRGHDGPAHELPAPGPSPLPRRSWETVVILVVVTVGVLVLLGRGYPANVALGVLAGVGLITAEISVRLAAPPARG